MMTRVWLAGVLFAFSTLIAQNSLAATCQDEKVEDHSYTICRVDLEVEDLRLFLKGPDDEVFGYFDDIEDMLQVSGQTLGFAMNAGMYHEDRAPVGYYLEDMKEHQPLLTGASAGNFGLLPNGVFCIGDRIARVVESKQFAQNRPECRFASQSGPMLVIDGALHHRFLRGSTSRYIRNGVGVREDGREAVFVISNEIVNFHRFARVFRDHLETPNALYFDGNISRLRAPDLDRQDLGFGPLGPIVGVVKPLDQ